MAKYEVEVIETLSRIVEVEAEDVSDACDKVHEMWTNQEIVLDGTDFVDVEFMEVG